MFPHSENTCRLMLVNLKIAVWKMLGIVAMLPMKWKGVRFGKGCFVDGKPQIHMAKGAKIILGNDVTLISRTHHNPLVEHGVMMSVLEPGAAIELHDHVGVSGCNLVCYNRITVGEYTIIGPGTLLFDSEGHNYVPETGWRIRKKRTGKPITIGKRCYIGMNCTILKGVTIGDDCVISAGSVLSRDVPSGHILHGTRPVCEPLPEYLRQC